jgi:hypothetical protein
VIIRIERNTTVTPAFTRACVGTPGATQSEAPISSILLSLHHPDTLTSIKPRTLASRCLSGTSSTSILQVDSSIFGQASVELQFQIFPMSFPQHLARWVILGCHSSRIPCIPGDPHAPVSGSVLGQTSAPDPRLGPDFQTLLMSLGPSAHQIGTLHCPPSSLIVPLYLLDSTLTIHSNLHADIFSTEIYMGTLPSALVTTDTMFPATSTMASYTSSER